MKLLKDNTKKDMFLPQFLAGFGIACIVLSLVIMLVAFFVSLYILIGFVFFFTLGFTAILCQQNQWAEMIDDETFIYSTMFGNKKQYRFSDIRSLRQNTDSHTLILEKGKVHIESIAVMSERFVDAINAVIEKQGNI